MNKARAAYRNYIAGFLLSIVLTLAVYIPVARHVHSHHTIYSDGLLLALMFCLAVVQLVVQLVFFLHLGRESKPRWNLMVFGLMLIVLLIVVGGSLWIMDNLNYHMLSPEQINQTVFNEESIHPH